ncbi:MAG: hypothetical protein AAGD09_03610 [Cyanobacteria bacterium P01_F01_bin.56]
MAEHDLRIGIKGTGASDFAASPVGALTITRSIRRGPPGRAYIGSAQISSTSINGVSIFNGPSHADKFLWTITCLLTVTQARQLTRLKDYADHRIKGIGQTKAGPNLRFIDETRYINDYERQQHGRSLLTQFDEADNAAQKYGYGVFDVHLILSDDFLEPFNKALGEDTDQLTFSVREV